MVGPISILSVLGGVAITTRNIAPRSALRAEQANNPKPPNLFERSDSVELSLGAREYAKLDQAKQLAESEKEEIRKLKQRDTEVRAHEQSHRAAGGQYAGAVSLDYTRGPDGNNYATEGRVPIDLSAVKDDPAATIRKMQQIKRAALAPGDPSGADRQIASQAAQIEQQAQAELRETKNQQIDTNDSAAKDPNEDIAQALSSLLAKATNPYLIAAGAVRQFTAPRFVNVLA